MSVNHQHSIAGRYSAAGEMSFRATHATSGSALDPTFVDATNGEIDDACREAGAAAVPYREKPIEARAAFLEAIARELEESVEAIVARACAETGLTDTRIRGELARTTGQLRLFADVVRAGDFLGVRIDRGDPDRNPTPKPDIRQYRIPLGPVAVFGAGNFPLAFSVCGGDTASALAAGCPVVVKAHPGHPGASALAAGAVERAVQASSMPAGVFSMIQGRSKGVGAALVQHSAIKAVGFTGSHAGGMALSRLASNRREPIPVYAEMGSVNPVFLLPSSLEQRAETIAAGLADSFTLGCGQFCTKPGLVFTAGGRGKQRFIEELAAHVGDCSAGVMLDDRILRAYEQGLDGREGMVGIERVAVGEASDDRAQAAVYRTDLDRFLAEPDLAAEIFGPTTLIVEADDPERFVEVAAQLPGQLTATVHASEGELADHSVLLDVLQRRAGRVLYNGFPTGVEVCHAMVHGGPYPATSDGRTTSVGTLAIDRFLRPVCLQDVPSAILPSALREENPLKVRRLVDGVWQGPT